MSQLLEFLETPPAPVVGSLEDIEHLLPVVARNVAVTVEGMKGSASLFRGGWQLVVVEVAKGHTEEMHALRQRFLAAFERRLRLLRDTQVLSTWLRTLGREEVPAPEVLGPDIEGMEALTAKVFDPWQTAEDLEDLAARDYPLTTADLDELAPTRRPPPAFHAEESKPF